MPDSRLVVKLNIPSKYSKHSPYLMAATIVVAIT